MFLSDVLFVSWYLKVDVRFLHWFRKKQFLRIYFSAICPECFRLSFSSSSDLLVNSFAAYLCMAKLNSRANTSSTVLICIDGYWWVVLWKESASFAHLTPAQGMKDWALEADLPRRPPVIQSQSRANECAWLQRPPQTHESPLSPSLRRLYLQSEGRQPPHDRCLPVEKSGGRTN